MRSLVVALVVSCSVPAWAQEVDPDLQEMLKKTQEMLGDRQKRDALIQNNANAKAADAQAQLLAGSDANTEEMYGLAASILETIVLKAGGDPTKMSQLLEKAQRDPAAFAAELTPHQQAKLKSLGQKIPKPKQ